MFSVNTGLSQSGSKRIVVGTVSSARRQSGTLKEVRVLSPGRGAQRQQTPQLMAGFETGHPPIKWGLLSTARISKKVWKALKECGVAEIVAVASRDVTHAETFISTCMSHAPFPERPEALGSYQELLDRPDIQAVYIPLPTAIRKEWVLKAVEARKSVLVEKPVGETAADVKEMITAAIRNGVHLMDGVNFMHSTRLTALRSSMADLGQIRTVHTAFSFRGDEAFFKGDIRTTGGMEPLGVVGDMGWYCIRLSLWVKDWQVPVRVRGTSHVHSETHVPFDFTGELLFPDGTSATFFCSFMAQLTQSALICGEHASIEMSDFVLPVAGRSLGFRIIKQDMVNDGLEVVVERAEHKVSVPEASHGHRTSQEANMVRHFSDLVRRGPVTTHWAEQMLSTQRIVDGVMYSAREGGRWVEITDE